MNLIQRQRTTVLYTPKVNRKIHLRVKAVKTTLPRSRQQDQSQLLKPLRQEHTHHKRPHRLRRFTAYANRPCFLGLALSPDSSKLSGKTNHEPPPSREMGGTSSRGRQKSKVRKEMARTKLLRDERRQTYTHLKGHRKEGTYCEKW